MTTERRAGLAVIERIEDCEMRLTRIERWQHTAMGAILMLGWMITTGLVTAGVVTTVMSHR